MGSVGTSQRERGKVGEKRTEDGNGEGGDVDLLTRFLGELDLPTHRCQVSVGVLNRQAGQRRRRRSRIGGMADGGTVSRPRLRAEGVDKELMTLRKARRARSETDGE